MRTAPQQSQIDASWSAMPIEAREEILEANLSARMLARAPDRNYWLAVGRGLSRLRIEAKHQAGVNHDRHPRYRTRFRLLLNRVPDLAELFQKDASSAQYARDMYEQWAEVETWLAALALIDEKTITRLNHPRVIMQRFSADHREKAQRADRPPTALQRSTNRIDELTTERDNLEQENRRLRLGQENFLQGASYTWQDAAEDIARIMLQAYPTKAKRVFAAGMRLAQARTPRTARVRRGRRGNHTEEE
jgi:hypothetical protein